MIKYLITILKRIFFGKPNKGEKANYVNNGIQPKLKKWEQ